jgi:hypothetical protein
VGELIALPLQPVIRDVPPIVDDRPKRTVFRGCQRYQIGQGVRLLGRRDCRRIARSAGHRIARRNDASRVPVVTDSCIGI